jgi:hypothetical protein
VAGDLLRSGGGLGEPLGRLRMVELLLHLLERGQVIGVDGVEVG